MYRSQYIGKKKTKNEIKHYILYNLITTKEVIRVPL